MEFKLKNKNLKFSWKSKCYLRQVQGSAKEPVLSGHSKSGQLSSSHLQAGVQSINQAINPSYNQSIIHSIIRYIYIIINILNLRPSPIFFHLKCRCFSAVFWGFTYSLSLKIKSNHLFICCIKTFSSAQMYSSTH